MLEAELAAELAAPEAELARLERELPTELVTEPAALEALLKMVDTAEVVIVEPSVVIVVKKDSVEMAMPPAPPPVPDCRCKSARENQDKAVHQG